MSRNENLCLRVMFCAVVNLVVLAVPTLAQVSTQSPDPASYGMTSGRLVATLAAVVALLGVAIGSLSLARPAGVFGNASVRIVAIVAGLIGVAVGGLRVMTASGIGTGGGRAGAIVALVLGSIAIVVGGLAMARSRRAS